MFTNEPGGFNPSFAATNAFNHMFKPIGSGFEPSPFNHMFNQIETSPLGNAGPSHFGYCNPNCEDPGFHITTQIKGFGQAEGFDNGLSDHYHFGHQFGPRGL